MKEASVKLIRCDLLGRVIGKAGEIPNILRMEPVGAVGCDLILHDKDSGAFFRVDARVAIYE